MQALIAAVGQAHEQTPVRLSLNGAANSERVPKNAPISVGHKASNKNAALWVTLGIIFVLVALAVGMSLPFKVNPPIAKIPPVTAVQPNSTLFPTELILSPMTEAVPPIDHPIESPIFAPTFTVTSTRPPTATRTLASCPGAAPQLVAIGDSVYVCTQIDRLIVKKTAGKDGVEMFRIYPSSSLTIVGGPICDDNSSWWQVKIPADTKAAKGQTALDDYYYIVNEKTGWVREGSDPKDTYYICKQ